IAVALVADENLDALALVLAAGFVDVHAIDLAAGSEIVSPHAQATATEHADFHDVHVAADEFCEMAVIRREIVPPLPDARPLRVGVEILPEWIGLLRRQDAGAAVALDRLA